MAQRGKAGARTLREVRVRPLLLVALVLVLLVGPALVVGILLGATDDSDVLEATPTTTTETAEPPVLAGPVDRYVALGDSYTAGPLIPWVRADPTTCLRSTRNYPSVLGQWLDAGRVVDVSCSGAATRNLRAPQRLFGASVPPQLDAVTVDTDLVTVGIGGNDFGLFQRLVSGDETTGVLRLLQRTGDRVADALAEVQARAPDAVVALVGYPRIVPAAGTCPELPFSRGRYGLVDRVERGLNVQLRRAAAEQDAVYVDTYAASRGHDACAGGRAWVNGRGTAVLEALAYHPYESGMVGTAMALHQVLRDQPPSTAVRRASGRALARRPEDTLTRQEQRFVATFVGG